MARMHPFYREEEINVKINGPGAPGERQLYRWLRDMPGTDDWDVLYDNRIHCGTEDVQTDFLVFCPGKGIVNVDAKGKGYHYNDNAWYLGNTPDKIFEQADRAINTFDGYIKNHLTEKSTWGAYGKLIVFTEVPTSSDGLRVSIPGDYHYMLPCQNMVEKLKDEIEAELNLHDYCHHCFTLGMYQQILSHFCQKFELKEYCFDFQNYDYKLDNCLTIKQQEIAAAIKGNTFVHITGGAGTGKTLLAIACAERFAKDNKRVLYVCYNKSLADYLKNKYRNRRFTITHFDVIPQELLDQKFSYPQKVNEEIDWEKSREMICNMLIEINDKYKFDRILVDESQDMTADMLESLQFLQKPVEKSKMAFFSDSAQSIFQTDWSFPYERFEAVEKCTLYVNMRNSDNIHKRIIEYSQEETVPGGWITGKEPEIFQGSVIDFIEKLHSREGIQANDIAVLAYNTDTLKSLNSHTQKRIYFTDKLTEWNENKILKTTVQSFKGLEANVIIIADTPSVSDNIKVNQLNYVGESRAKYRLYIHSAD